MLIFIFDTISTNSTVISIVLVTDYTFESALFSDF